MNGILSDIANAALWLRFVLAYPLLVGVGLVLGVIAIARFRHRSGRDRVLYVALSSTALALSCVGTWGGLGVWQYGVLTEYTLSIGRETISIGFSLSVLWLAGSMSALLWCVAREELNVSNESVRAANRASAK